MPIIKFVPNAKCSPVGKLADAELHFSDSPLAGLKLVGFAIWELRPGGGRNVTFAAYQAPLLHPGSLDALAPNTATDRRMRSGRRRILCCPEAILGGQADSTDDPIRLAVPTDRISSVLAPLANETVTTIVGFTELADDGRLECLLCGPLPSRRHR